MSTAMSTMSGMSMPMESMASTATNTVMASATSTMDSMSSMGSLDHMDMDMGSSMGACKISMTWNWNTIDACFLTETWHIKTRGQFAGTCIGVILLVMVLELLRRASKEYDRFLVRQHQRAYHAASSGSSRPTTGINTPEEGKLVANSAVARSTTTGADAITPARASCDVPPITADTKTSPAKPTIASQDFAIRANVQNALTAAAAPRFRPTLVQQLVRALLYMLQFADAYIIMLLAMYYNGYIIICIFIGAFLGRFAFDWESFGL
ncbi:uncharacterized protein K452DRAFT_288724 [Aplosporella prunicola CBS 121167]|uniref:Copper transport protein n=1 Tax=Aplosporella prunicola CBS 121167 TaxID=1176127 RepID=A0A6A6BCK9_9PEZI|nr:uncharacterized protein K452DRAFT_288724 [Aplosporella prunicola CBS 121167]KAF2140627.1 hypothetical protein K452DRAFT_288724 [Aplosporella prunicola CBS 121167]